MTADPNNQSPSAPDASASSVLEGGPPELTIFDAGAVTPAVQPFPTVHIGEISDVSEPLDFVEGLLTDGGLSVVYGPSNSGKSYFVLDLAASVAGGGEFRGKHQTDQGAVIYVALEGRAGLKNRIIALKRDHRLSEDAPLHLCFSPVSLLKAEHGETLVATVREVAEKWGIRPRLVIVDTLARAMAGGDENSGKDMTFAVETADRVRVAMDTHVLLVHHSGKDSDKGARGHSSLRAAADTEIWVTPTGKNEGQAIVKKQRDLPIDDAPMRFRLVPMELGTSRRGKPITSCVVEHVEAAQKNAGRPLIFTAEPLLNFLPAGGKRWQELAKEHLGMGRSTFFDRRRDLIAEGAIWKGLDGLYELSPAFIASRSRSETTEPEPTAQA